MTAHTAVAKMKRTMNFSASVAGSILNASRLFPVFMLPMMYVPPMTRYTK